MRRACLVALVALASCAPQSQLPKADQAKVEAERKFQADLAYQDILEKWERMARVSYRLGVASADLCGDKIAWRTGFNAVSKATLDKTIQSATVWYMNGSEKPTIVLVTPGTPAAAAGLQVGDIVAQVNGESVPDGKDGQTFIADKLKSGAGAPLQIAVQRGAFPTVVSITPTKVCGYSFSLVDKPEINAFADGSQVHITTGMMRFIQTDEELALVGGHELAHNFRGHIDAKRGNAMAGQVVGAILDGILGAVLKAPTGGAMGNAMGQAGAGAFSQDFEREADYAGLYVMARAGYDITGAPNFWRRMAVTNPKGISHATSHPATPERFVNLEAAIAEIKDKQAKGFPLVPNEKPQTATAN